MASSESVWERLQALETKVFGRHKDDDSPVEEDEPVEVKDTPLDLTKENQ